MKLQIEKKEASDVEIELPIFFKCQTGYEYRAVLSEDDYREVFVCDPLSILKIDSTERHTQSIINAVSDWKKISEKEFMEKWEETIKSFSFMPTAKEYFAGISEADENYRINNPL